MKAELERIRDQLKCSLNMGGLKGSAEWVVGEIDRLLGGLPVGVPDGEWVMHMLEDRWPDSGERVEVEAFADWLREVLAAPTVKAEQVQCCIPTDEERALLAAGEYTPEELWGGPRPTCPKCIGKAPSLLAAGSADVEALESWVKFADALGLELRMSDALWENARKLYYRLRALMDTAPTVKAERVPVAAISKLLKHWEDLKPGESENVDAVRNWLEKTHD